MHRVEPEVVSSIAAGQFELVAPILDEHFFALLLSSPETLHTLFAHVPDEWLTQHPRYLMARTILRGLTGQFMLLDSTAHQLFSEWVAAQSNPLARDQLGIVHAALRDRLSSGRFAEADELADRALMTIAVARDSNGFTDVLPLFLLEIGVAKLQTGEVQAALSAFSEAVRWASAREEHPVLPHARGYVALAFSLMDDHSHALEFLPVEPSIRAARGTLTRRLQEPEILARLLIALGRLDHDSVRDQLSKLDPENEHSAFWWIGAHVRAEAELYWGDVSRGIRFLERTLLERQHLADGNTMAGVRLRSDLANLNISAGKLIDTNQVLSSPGLDSSSTAIRASTARAALADERPHQALRALALPDGASVRPPRLAILRVAALAMQIGGASAREWHGVVSEVVERGSLNSLVDVPQEFRKNAFAALPAGIPDIPVPFTINWGERLTEREYEILGTLRSHPTVASLAAALFITPNTVRTHLKSAYRKLGVHSRQQALWEFTRLEELSRMAASEPSA